jgi:hypothetical protein
MLSHAEALCGRQVRGDLTCLLCNRTVAEVRGRRGRRLALTSVQARAPEHMDAIRRMRCPYCAGRLLVQDTEDVYADRGPLSAEDLRPRRGRPVKVSRAS